MSLIKARQPPSPKAVVVAASTGGPQALHIFCAGLCHFAIQIPIFVVLHMPDRFASLVASQVERISGLPSAVSQDNTIAHPGHVYVAESGSHLKLELSGHSIVMRHDHSDAVNYCRPSADILFASAAKVCRGRVIGVVLSGMGVDGLNGSRAIVDAGGEVFAQNQSSSVVWGMPGAVVRNGLASVTDTPDAIARKIILRLQHQNRFVA